MGGFWPIVDLRLCARISGIAVNQASQGFADYVVRFSIACLGMAWHGLALRLPQFCARSYVLTRATPVKSAPSKALT